MKTAIIIIPTIGQSANPSMYLSSCANTVLEKGYIVLHTTHWNDYKDIDIKRLTEKVIDGVDAFFLFVDFGVSIFMIDILDRYYVRDKNGPRFLKEINIEASLNVGHVNLNGILLEISQKSDIPLEALRSKSRKREIVENRQIYFKRAKDLTACSLASIGALVGKDHATVLHGIKVVDTVRELGQLYRYYFNGGKDPVFLRCKKTKPIKKAPSETPVIQMNPVGIQVNPPVRRISAYANIPSCTDREYHGYFEHAR